MTRLRELAFKLRGGLWTLLFVAILITARPVQNKALLAFGLVLVVLGQLWRFWAAGSIGRYRGEHVNANQLVTWGPYALMRNPLYFGNGLIGLGWGLMAGLWAAVLFGISFIILYGLLIIPHEEAFLLDHFGDAYREYQRNTGAFYPHFKVLSSSPSPSSRLKGPFSFEILRKSEIHTVLTTVVGTALILCRVFFLFS